MPLPAGEGLSGQAVRAVGVHITVLVKEEGREGRREEGEEKREQKGGKGEDATSCPCGGSGGGHLGGARGKITEE